MPPTPATSCVSSPSRKPELLAGDAELHIDVSWDPQSAHHHRARQRHRHEPRRSRRQYWHHRQLRHASFPGGDEHRAERRRPLDRPVRRRFLFGLRGGRQGHGAEPSRRFADQRWREMGKRRQRRIFAGAGRSAGARHGSRAASEGRRRRIPQALGTAFADHALLRSRRVSRSACRSKRTTSRPTSGKR